MTTNRIDDIEQVFSNIDREVWIVTSAADNRTGGLVATWVSQASIDRENPVVLIGIAPNHFTADLIDASGTFALHLITEKHIHHAWNFAIGSGRERDKLANVATCTAETGAPILTECLAWLDCRVFAVERTGDRNYYWADVFAGSSNSQGAPLTESRLIRLANDEQKQNLRRSRDADINAQRPQQQVWRSNLPTSLQLR